MRKTFILATSAIFLATLVFPSIIKADAEIPKAHETLTMRVTAYSSSVDETDDTPFVTASGMRVRDGIVATNVLPFGTKVKIQALFGNKIFIVEDRMNHRMKNGIDIWMPTKSAALRFGVSRAEVTVITDTKLSLK